MVAITSTSNPSTAESKTKKTRRSRQKKNSSFTKSPLETHEDIHDEHDDDLPTDKTESLTPNEDGTDAEGNDDTLMIDDSAIAAPASQPAFPPLPASALVSSAQGETRRIPIPPHRFTPLRKDWINIFSPLTEMCGLQVRMNTVRKCVEMRVSFFYLPILLWSIGSWSELTFHQKTSKHTKEIGALQRGADFVKAYALGFDVNVRRLSSVDGFITLNSRSCRMRWLCYDWMIFIWIHLKSRM